MRQAMSSRPSWRSLSADSCEMAKEWPCGQGCLTRRVLGSCMRTLGSCKSPTHAILGVLQKLHVHSPLCDPQEPPCSCACSLLDMLGRHTARACMSAVRAVAAAPQRRHAGARTPAESSQSARAPHIWVCVHALAQRHHSHFTPLGGSRSLGPCSRLQHARLRWPQQFGV